MSAITASTSCRLNAVLNRSITARVVSADGSCVTRQPPNERGRGGARSPRVMIVPSFMPATTSPNRVTAEILQAIQQIVGSDGLVCEPERLRTYESDGLTN